MQQIRDKYFRNIYDQIKSKETKMYEGKLIGHRMCDEYSENVNYEHLLNEIVDISVQIRDYFKSTKTPAFFHVFIFIAGGQLRTRKTIIGCSFVY